MDSMSSIINAHVTIVEQLVATPWRGMRRPTITAAPLFKTT